MHPGMAFHPPNPMHPETLRRRCPSSAVPPSTSDISPGLDSKPSRPEMLLQERDRLRPGLLRGLHVRAVGAFLAAKETVARALEDAVLVALPEPLHGRVGGRHRGGDAR